MKTIEEIEHLSFEELERVASDESIRAPHDLVPSLEESIKAAEISGSLARRQRRGRTCLAIGVPAIAAAALAAILLIPSNTPKDTFDDPRLAYIEVERIMSYISEKTDVGLSQTAKVSKSMEIINSAIESVENKSNAVSK